MEAGAPGKVDFRFISISCPPNTEPPAIQHHTGMMRAQKPTIVPPPTRRKAPHFPQTSVSRRTGVPGAVLWCVEGAEESGTALACRERKASLCVSISRVPTLSKSLALHRVVPVGSFCGPSPTQARSTRQLQILEHAAAAGSAALRYTCVILHFSCIDYKKRGGGANEMRGSEETKAEVRLSALFDFESWRLGEMEGRQTSLPSLGRSLR